MPKRPSIKSRRRGRIDGLAVRVSDGPMLTDVEFVRALRMLARMIVRSQQAQGDHQAIITETKASSELTVAPRARRVDSDEAA